MEKWKKSNIGPSIGDLPIWDRGFPSDLKIPRRSYIVWNIYSDELLGRFDTELHLAKKVLFYHGNVSAHTSPAAMVRLVELYFELLRHPPYSPDLGTVKLEKVTRGKEIWVEWVCYRRHEGLFWRSPENVLLDGLKKLVFCKTCVFLLLAKYLSGRPRIYERIFVFYIVLPNIYLWCANGVMTMGSFQNEGRE